MLVDQLLLQILNAARFCAAVFQRGFSPVEELSDQLRLSGDVWRERFVMGERQHLISR